MWYTFISIQIKYERIQLEMATRALRASGDHKRRRPASRFDGLTHLPSKAHYGRPAITSGGGQQAATTDLRIYLLRRITGVRGSQDGLTHLPSKAHYGRPARPASRFDGLTHLPSKAHYGPPGITSGGGQPAASTDLRIYLLRRITGAHYGCPAITSGGGQPAASTDLRIYLLRRITGVRRSKRRMPASRFDGLTHLPSKAHYGRPAITSGGQPTASTDSRIYLLRRITGVRQSQAEEEAYPHKLPRTSPPSFARRIDSSVACSETLLQDKTLGSLPRRICLLQESPFTTRRVSWRGSGSRQAEGTVQPAIRRRFSFAYRIPYRRIHRHIFVYRSKVDCTKVGYLIRERVRMVISISRRRL
ncbi:unnamed protein product [Acanthosepion pharaonis]|uniref:Uncharacterized protein n=1 Tax=Acanthosepion pharaonis TaxID=158019 RepID=A0A812AMV6_ACAPH|nr:unnamed protein product [Sepia pharaonis]